MPAAKSQKSSESHCAKFLAWVRTLKGRNMLYRGLSDADYHNAESSLARRLRGEQENAHIPADLFLKETQKLLNHAVLKGYNIQNGVKMGCLELLAELQHCGAATCLIDFTKSPLVALWFACRAHPEKAGKVAAFNADAESNIKIQPEHLSQEQKIAELLSPEKKGPDAGISIRVWETKLQNARIIAQQSVFVFGEPRISADNEYPVKSGDKQEILKELLQYGISEESLFSDFDGFARILNAHNSPAHLSAEDNFNIGEECRKNEKDDLAEYYYSLAIDQKSKYAEAYYFRGNVKSIQKKWNDAIGDYDKAIEHDYSSIIDAYYHRAAAKMGIENYAEAVADFDEVIKEAPSFQNAYMGRAFAKVQLKKYEDAISDYTQALVLAPNASAYNNRGNVYSQLKKYDLAIGDYNKAITLAPEDTDAYYNRGNVYLRLKKYELAIRDYDKAIEINPEDAIAYYNRALAKHALGDKDGAKADFAEAKRLDPNLEIPKLPE